MKSNNYIPFNKPYLSGKETEYINDAVESGKISGNGKYTKLCQDYFQNRYGFYKCLLTTSCTDALEMAAILLNIKEGDEVIMPSFTFVSTANAFVLRGAKIVFADSKMDEPNLDVNRIETLITPLTKAIVVVHYAGVACDMDAIMDIANRHNLYVVEDAAQAIDSHYIGANGVKKPLGSIGHLAAFSFHETKNIISGEGGMLVVNDPTFEMRSEIIWEKGTNRSAFFRGEVDKYAWVDIGSSFLPSEIVAAFLYAQLEHLDSIQQKRKLLWNMFFNLLSNSALESKIKMPFIPHYAENNAHMFYLVCDNINTRTKLIEVLKKHNFHSVFHYLSLHNSPLYYQRHDGRELFNSDKYAETLLRLPLFYELSVQNVKDICKVISEFCTTSEV
ncbi:MAG: dTDP-4-amino-4,6-dideoxygalactose transaminase [Bacteroidia bacterium]|nr:dTDP-4-amino-4,6-dideoxygalactose transaminase [Bacteroidia bacterium]